MAVDLVPVSIDVPKEGKEVIDALAAVVSHFVNGGDLPSAAALLPAVMQAVEGHDKIGDEISEAAGALGGYAAIKLLDAVKKKA